MIQSRRSLGLLALIGLAGVLSANPARAQWVSVGFGNGIVEDDPFCPTPPETFTTFRATYETNLWGVNGTFNNEDYPWPPMDEGLSSARQEAFLNHAGAIQLTFEFYPLGLLGETSRGVGELIRPFVGVGVHRTGDGEPDDADTGGIETYGVEGGTSLLLTAGAKLTKDVVGRFGLRLEGRVNSVRSGDFTELTPGGGTIDVPGKALNWVEWSLAFTFRR